VSGDLEAAHRELTKRVMGRPGVSGTAISADASGRPRLTVYVSDGEAEASLPGSIRGIPVVAERTGPFRPR
jgi:hypothetical protein